MFALILLSVVLGIVTFLLGIVIIIGIFIGLDTVCTDYANKGRS